MPGLVDWQTAAERLLAGELGVIPTDTLYGIVGSALKPSVVERIYEIRRRERDKPFIVLIGSWADLDRLSITLDHKTRSLLEKVWPGPVSVIVSTPGSALAYLHRGTQSLALRMPAKGELRELLEATGPLVAPSANEAGQPPAKTVPEAHHYFGEAVFYLDEGELESHPSALVDARTDPPRILRPVPGFSLN